MSHFTVMVVGDNVDDQLLPFHEFECTGDDNEYVQDIDITENLRKDYEHNTETMYCDKNGNKYPYKNDRFYREPTDEEKDKLGMGGSFGVNNNINYRSKNWGDDKENRLKVHYMPDGFVKRKIPMKDIRTFKEFCEYWDDTKFIKNDEIPDLNNVHKYGYGITDKDDNVIKVINRTNPNSKWDWYQIGGRWSGSLKVKPIDKDTYPEYSNGEKSWCNKNEPERAGYCDVTLKANIDIEGMEEPLRNSATSNYDQWHNGIKQLKDDDDKKRKWIFDNLGFASKIEMDRLNNMKRQEYINCVSVWSPYAILWNGKWYSKGEMGYFGCSYNEENDWKGQFKELWNEIPDDSLISMVDAHI